MAPVQERIVEALRGAGGELSMSALLQEVRSESTSATDVKSAVLPLILLEKIEVTPEHNLRLRKT